MKNKFLLPALFLAAGFTACTQEDLVENNATGMDEVVGAKLLGTGFVANLDNEAETRVVIEDGVAKWEKGDKAAVAWAVAGKVADEQKESNENLYKTLYANHMLVHDGTKFNSNSNVYEGWHFSYAPYKRMAKPSIYGFDINVPLTEADLKIDQLENAPMFSNREFVSTDQVNNDGMVLVTFPLQRIVNTIKPKLTVDEAFGASDLLKGLAIEEIVLSAGANKLFIDTLQVNPAGLKSLYDAEGNLNVIDETFFGKFGSGAAFELPEGEDYVTSVSAEIANAEAYNLGNAVNTVRLFLAPTQDASAVKLEDLSFRVNVAGEQGYFLIDSEDIKTNATNKTALEQILGMLQGTLEVSNATSTHTFDLTKTGEPNKTIDFSLTTENFVTDYSDIKSIDDWKKAVALVTALGQKEVTFTITGAIKFDNGVINMPENDFSKIKVEVPAGKESTNRLVLNSGTFVGWPENLNSPAYLTIETGATVTKAEELPNVAIINNGTLEVSDGELTADKEVIQAVVGPTGAVSLTNNGTIKLGLYSKAQNVRNNGNIEIVYGSYVGLKSGYTHTGNIKFLVTDAEVDNPERIKNVINTTAGEGILGVACANVLMFKKGVHLTKDFDFTKPVLGEEGEFDPYKPGVDGEDSNLEIPGLNKISLEIVDANVKSTNAVTVANVTVTATEGNTLELNNINVSGDLEVNGNVSVKNESISGNLTVENGGIVETTTIGGNVETDGEVIAETIEGDVTATDATIKAETIGGKVTIVSGTNAVEGADVAGDVEVQDGTATLTDINIAGDLENKGITTVEGKDAAIANIVNYGTLNANTNITVATISHEYNCLTNVQTTSETEFKTIWYTVENGSKEKVGSTRKGEVKYLGGDAILANLKAAIANGGDVTLVADVTIDAPLAIAADKEVNLNLNGKTLTWDNNSATSDYALRNLGKLTLSNGTIVGDGTNFAPCLYTEGEAVLNNCTLISENSNAIKMDKASKLTINGGYYESKNATGQALRVGNYVDGYAYAWDLTINGGEFIGTWAGLYIVNNYVGLGDNIGKAVIKNASFKGNVSVLDSGVKGSDIVFDKVKNVTIEGCTLQTSTIHSETTVESVINKVSVEKIDDVYNELF